MGIHLDPLSLMALTGGIALHLLVYRLGEWDTRSALLVAVHIGVVVSASIILRILHNHGEFNATLSHHDLWRICRYYLLGVYGSMLIYRAFFHRLRKFPGPFLARLSNIYPTLLASKNLHLYKEVERLHMIYGDYIRLGPTELSITDPAAVQAIYGNQSKATKGPWYTLLDPRVCLSFTRDKKEHASRRKIWDQGFSTKAVRAYELVVAKYAQQLVDVVERDSANPINMTQWFSYFAFDVMGNLAFGKSFNMISEGKEAYFLKTIRTDMKNIGYLRHLPWIFPIFMTTPILNANNLKFWKWIEDQFTERCTREPEQRDIFSWILDAYKEGPQSYQDTLNLHGDGYLIVVAGSDTTSTTLTHLFFHIASDKSLTQRLQEQIDALSELNDGNLSTIDLLDAAIYETLRLHPAVPSGLQRLTPPEGMSIGKTHVPGNTIVHVPFYTIFRDPRAFMRPHEFIPERWTTSLELVKDKSVYIPFNTGPFACVGKRLALMELRRVTAELLSRFDIDHAPGNSKDNFLDDAMDTFTLTAAPLPLIFKKRLKV